MLSIDCKFPGGNIIVHDMEGDLINVSPDLRDTEGGWFYWAFRLCGAAGRHLRFHFNICNPVGMRGPAISTDGRKTWHWTTEPWTIDSFEITVPADCDEIYLAFAPTYTQENWDRFMETLPSFAPDGSYEAGYFTESRKGRKVELFHIGPSPDDADKVAVFTARHHCCEMIASWVMEGVIAAILKGETEETLWLRDHASISFVPFVDKDGVEDGDQGKNRRPHDHNRDYTEFLYPETTAVARLVSRLQKEYGVVSALDLHCPWIRDYPNDIVYMPGSANPRSEECQIAFGNILETCIPEGSLPFFQKNFYPYGTGWNVASNYTQGLSFTAWAAANGIGLTSSVETAYASASDAVVTPGAARLLGNGIAIALARYMRQR